VSPPPPQPPSNMIWIIRFFALHLDPPRRRGRGQQKGKRQRVPLKSSAPTSRAWLSKGEPAISRSTLLVCCHRIDRSTKIGKVPLAHGAIAHQPDSTRKIEHNSR